MMMLRLRRKQWSVFVAPRLREALLKRSSSLTRWLALLFLFLACVTLIIAMARPQGDAGTEKEKTVGRNVMIALDISRSMRVQDVSPDRLTQAKVMIYELLESLSNERIGFIGFAGTPHTYAPLTVDHTAIRETVEQMDENWAPLGGSDLAGAVQLGIDTLKKTGQKSNTLIVLSDGEEVQDEQTGPSLSTVIDEARRAGVYVVAIGVGTENGGHVPNKYRNDITSDRSGNPVISRLHVQVLRQLAEGTKGKFAVAGSGADVPALVESVVAGMDAFEIEGRERKISIEFYQWLVLPAIFLLMASIIAGTRWRGVKTAAVAAGILLPTAATQAGEVEAKQALSGKRYEEAQKSYHELAEKAKPGEKRARYHLGEAAAAYRGEDFRSARSAFSQSLLSNNPEVIASGHAGMGNSLFQLGWQTLTQEAYPTDPKSIPDLNRFDTIVKEAIAKELAKRIESEDAPEEDSHAFEPLIKNWSDAVRHYKSALEKSPKDPVALKNSEMSMTYLKRLKELLEEEKKDTEQAMAQAMPGQGPPMEGEGEGEGDGEGEDEKEGKGKGKGKGKKGQKPEGEEDGEGGDEKQKKGKNGEEGEDGEGKGDKSGAGKGSDKIDPNESPSERAERILKDNADTEKGPLTRAHREYMDAQKDW